MFGYLNEDVEKVRYDNTYNPLPLEQRSPELAAVFNYIESGAFGDGHIYESLLKTVGGAHFLGITTDIQVYEHDHYLVSNDFGSYLEAQSLVDELWGSDKDEWTKKSILTAFAMGDFSSDRSVQDYADGVSISGSICGT